MFDRRDPALGADSRAAVTSSVRAPRSAPRAVVAAAISLVCVLIGPSTAQAREQLLGAQSHALWSGSATEDMEREFQLLGEAGANAVRVDLSWSSLETEGKSRFSKWYVDKFEAFLEKAESRRIAVIATLWSTPCWASSAPESLRQGCSGAWWDRGVDRYPPSSTSDYGDAVAWVAQRWGHRLAALEIWNEPNLLEQNFLKSDDPAAAYTRILTAAYPRAKHAAPGLTVLGGALAFSDERFLERLYQLGAGDSFDALSFHPYNEWRDPDDPWKQEWRKYTFVTGVPAMHEVLRAHGQAHKQLWLTEFGFSSCGDAESWCVTEQEQAEYTRDSLRLVKGWSFVEAGLVYNLRNKGSDPSGREDQFGLVRRDFSRKPAYTAFKQALAGPPAPAGVATGSRAGRVRILRRRRLRLGRRGAVRVPVRCVAASQDLDCVGRLTIRTRRGAHSAVRAGTRVFRLRPGHTRGVRVRLTRGSRRAVARRGRLRITALAATRETGQARRIFRVVRLR
jgi:polysaccharide biosynthesis protein PslG